MLWRMRASHPQEIIRVESALWSSVEVKASTAVDAMKNSGSELFVADATRRGMGIIAGIRRLGH